MKLAIFDIGSNDGLDGIVLAYLNPKSFIYSFEPNTELNKKIILNKKRIEKFFKVKIYNHKVYNYAVSNKNKYQNFYINNHDLLSSLEKINKNFKNKDDLNIKRVFKTKVTRLDKFCTKEKIDYIQYLHSDTQGSDLKVLQGLGTYRNKLISGVIETSVDNKTSRYIKACNLSDVKKKLKIWNFRIIKINPNFTDIEYDVYFTNKKVYENIPQVKTKYNQRFFRRIILKKVKLKDHFTKLFLKLIT